MNILICSFIAALAAVAFVATPEALAQEDGKALFLKNKCRSCHPVSAQGIVKKADEEEKNDKEVPDLSGVGLQRNADWITKYLLKKEAIDGEKHSKKFKGGDEELAVLSKWLETLKTEVKAEKKKGGK